MSMKRLEELEFSAVSLGALHDLSEADMDALPYGVVGLSPAGLVEVYSATESRLAGLPADSVLGTHFFLTTAQCMNNFMVAQRLEDEPQVDSIIDYVLTFRMRPTPVRLRMLKSSAFRRTYLLIQR